MKERFVSILQAAREGLLGSLQPNRGLRHPLVKTLSLALVVGILAMVMVMGPRPGPWNWNAQETEKTLTQIPGYGNDDGRQGVYLHWQFHEALADGRLSLRDENQLHPIGTPRAQIDGGNRIEMLLSSLLRMFFDWPSWMTWTVLLWIPINTLAFVPLGLRLWKKSGPTVAAGITWTLMPCVIEQMAAGRLTQVCMIGVPLAVAGILGVVEEGRKRDIWMAGLGMALTAYGYWFYAIFLFTLCPLFILHGHRWHRPIKTIFRDLIRAASVSIVFILPLALHVFWPALTGGEMPGTELDSSCPEQRADSLQLSGDQTRGNQHWFPFILIPGILLTAWKGKRRSLWILCALSCVVFAMGEVQDIGGKQVLLPYYPLWRFVPGFSMLNHPERWLMVGGLFLAIATTDAIARLWHWGIWIVPIGVLVHLWNPTLNGYADPGLANGQNLTASNLPMANTGGDWTHSINPQFWSELADPEGGALIVVPLLRSHRTCVFQPFHGRPLLGGMNEHQIVSLPNEFVEYFEGSPLLMSIWALGKGVDSDIEVWQSDLDRLRADGFDTIVFSQDDWDFLPQQGDQGVKDIQILARLKDAFGEPWYRDEKAAFFHLPQTGKEGVPPTALEIFPPIPAKGEMPANPGGTIRDPERSRPGGGSCGQDDDGFLPEGPPVQDVEGNRSGGGPGRKNGGGAKGQGPPGPPR